MKTTPGCLASSFSCEFNAHAHQRHTYLRIRPADLATHLSAGADGLLGASFRLGAGFVSDPDACGAGGDTEAEKLLVIQDDSYGEPPLYT
jgi:hypothetical protein